MSRRPVAFWVAILLVFSGSMMLWFAKKSRDARISSEQDTTMVQAVRSHEDESGPIGESKWVDFDLTDQYGRPFSSDSLKGKVWVGGVFFSSCTSVCRAQNQQMAKLQEKYADQGIELVAITCDPDRDTPECSAIMHACSMQKRMYGTF